MMKKRIFKTTISCKTADGSNIILIIYILSITINFLITFLNQYRHLDGILQKLLLFEKAEYSRQKNRFYNFSNNNNNNNVTIEVQFFMDTFTFSDFESPLILFSWWRDKIS